MAKIERTIAPLPQTEEEIVPQKLLFYCRNCEKVISAKQTKQRFTFLCPVCGKTDVAYGTAVSVQNFYHIAEDALTPVDGPYTAPIVPLIPPRSPRREGGVHRGERGDRRRRDRRPSRSGNAPLRASMPPSKTGQ